MFFNHQKKQIKIFTNQQDFSTIYLKGIETLYKEENDGATSFFEENNIAQDPLIIATNDGIDDLLNRWKNTFSPIFFKFFLQDFFKNVGF